MRCSIAALQASAALLLAGFLAAPSGAAEKVTIYRDGFGVPHVQAETSEAVMVGAG